MVTPAEAKVLVVGAGGIGCELLKNLVLTGFRDIHVIDLDTIDFSNLNRQFLFRKEHVGKSKALVAKESVLALCPEANITALHDTVIKQEYGRDFFRRFHIVLNALDNRQARNHVNRLCLAADVPLVESGTQGYLGQVEPILKGVSECYECKPKAAQRTFAGCTIRNTPSEPIHCIVWAKHLFNQLFGLQDADEEVSPDMMDPELGGTLDEINLMKSDTGFGNVERVSTRQWAAERGYEPASLFDKLFHDDIVYLRNMANLWKKRREPEACKFPKEALESWTMPSGMRDQRVWSEEECAANFRDSVTQLKERLAALPDGDYLTWDKDDDVALDFVTACANVRMRCFGMEAKSQFEVKSMAGNIIPAIATTNAVIAGFIVLQALKILRGKKMDCRAVFLNRSANPVSRVVIQPAVMDPPNPKCYVCADKNEVYVITNTKTSTIKAFRDNLLKDMLNMAAPDVANELTGAIVVSSEDGETDDIEDKVMADLGMGHDARLLCDDFLQNFQLVVNVVHSEEKLSDDAEFEVKGELPKPKEENMQKNENGAANDNEPSASSHNGGSGDDATVINDDDDLIVLDDTEELSTVAKEGEPASKKARLS
ncbi:SUMO-activating enzyme subunit 2-like [Varroa jacobsoni]|uniref:SUMO-activating enzyme subunit n=1 Tax=Varroa destructor TaxID=109461 RepID=A0A7M7KI69_VARDE|nr:SUMO-activating enzyme subunit 2-like [Varroa destructor]XP_022667315.1 SUMO-activating enzyme subunit 2-like [Varroa destructor]XP_022667316.1 SUMO-activating enzyme subunit 2-like [Varroa destructor]XP_022667317.1 SUMO-activating enzyme subunit 2-like [Varroa destructor]XP_022667318.1 SUMO-activating enzyme subunit 2-like [Varroa destructor]XP_022702809.1 SUMO-activating enzyme subunit 2-like [Varroa jacobsoni]XP_022702810.1 SUMO-activating enzyme subunit 2-like [Varroa jacobsoni]XP_022